jgi:hypothetical protein
MAFLRLHKILAYLEATAESRCVVEGEVLCAKLLILYGGKNKLHILIPVV